MAEHLCIFEKSTFAGVGLEAVYIDKIIMHSVSFRGASWACGMGDRNHQIGFDLG